MNKKRWITAAGILAGAVLVVIFAVMVYESQYRGPYEYYYPNGEPEPVDYVGERYNYLQLGWAGVILSCGLVIVGAAMLLMDIKERNAPELPAMQFILNVAILGLVIYLFMHGNANNRVGSIAIPDPGHIARLMIFAFMASLPATVLSCLPFCYEKKKNTKPV